MNRIQYYQNILNSKLKITTNESQINKKYRFKNIRSERNRNIYT